MTPLPEIVLSRISMLVTEQMGLRFPPDRWPELARGVASAALELGIADLLGWAENLAEGRATEAQLNALAHHLTISETYFFRHRETFIALEKEMLPPRLAVRREQGRPLRLWSAGCASGEEPYSIAILLRQAFPNLRPDSVVIAATDINSRVIARAERGVYSEWSFRDAPTGLKDAYFKRKGASRFELKPEIRQMVRFSVLNLATPLFPAEFGERGDFDVIICRNVLMYFSGEWQAKIVRRFTAALAPGGWLVVSPCDITAAQSASLPLRLLGPGLYLKTSGAEARVVPPPEFAAPPVELFPPPATALAVPPLAAPEPFSRAVPEPPAPPAAGPAAPAVGSAGEIAADAARDHADRGELGPALVACDQAIALENTNPGFHYLRGCILQEQNRLPEAAAAFRRVLYLDPRAVMAEFALGCLAERAGRARDARHHFAVVHRLLADAHRGDAVAGSEGLTVARLRAVVERNLDDHAA